jgi:hypothetical protein
MQGDASECRQRHELALLAPRSKSRLRCLTRLERRTYLVSGGVSLMNIQNKMTIMDYGEGLVEGTVGVSMPGPKKTTPRGESENREQNIERSRRRAQANVRRKCMAGGFDHLLTLTYRENNVDKYRAWHDLERFIRKMHTYVPDWRYIVVMEFQKRGAIHFHLAVVGYQDVDLLRHCWRSVVMEGNIDVSWKKSKKGGTWSRANLSRYIPKYITKNTHTDLNERSFRCTPGIKIIKQYIYFSLAINALDYLAYKIEALTGNIPFIWTPEGINSIYGWGCSWI